MEVGGWSDVGCVDEDKAVFVELELGNNCGIGKAAINEESVAGGTNSDNKSNLKGPSWKR